MVVVAAAEGSSMSVMSQPVPDPYSRCIPKTGRLRGASETRHPPATCDRDGRSRLPGVARALEAGAKVSLGGVNNHASDTGSWRGRCHHHPPTHALEPEAWTPELLSPTGSLDGRDDSPTYPPPTGDVRLAATGPDPRHQETRP